jgi:hypothetical protein
VAVVLDGDVTTAGAMGVIVIGVHSAVIAGHGRRPQREGFGRGRPSGNSRHACPLACA